MVIYNIMRLVIELLYRSVWVVRPHGNGTCEGERAPWTATASHVTGIQPGLTSNPSCSNCPLTLEDNANHSTKVVQGSILPYLSSFLPTCRVKVVERVSISISALATMSYYLCCCLNYEPIQLNCLFVGNITFSHNYFLMSVPETVMGEVSRASHSKLSPTLLSSTIGGRLRPK